MNYKVAKDKISGKFQIKEIDTDRIIFESDSHEKAYQIYRCLKNGSGFDGEIPGFFTTVYDNKLTIE